MTHDPKRTAECCHTAVSILIDPFNACFWSSAVKLSRREVKAVTRTLDQAAMCIRQLEAVRKERAADTKRLVENLTARAERAERRLAKLQDVLATVRREIHTQFCECGDLYDDRGHCPTCTPF